MKLGSLFDGSGGFPLAGAIHGITPVWAAEIEAYPIKVTKARFPQMKHLGSVLDVNGAEVEPVDIITFGSPCQDLSVAGKQAGLHKGERSNLFFEAIRIIKEMRESTDGIYPRIAVWENVPGAYSSNKGEDFRAVLQAFCSIKDETADVPRPASGKWHPAGTIVGNGWSIAWRTFDAQFWGVPQRRKRIYLIADFGSERAGEVLFEPESVRRDSAPGGKAGEETADNAEGSAGRSGQCVAWTYRGREGGCNIEYAEEVAYALRNPLGGGSNANICYPAGDAEGSAGRSVCAYDIGEARLRNPQEYFELSPTLTQRCGTGGNNTPAVCYAVDGYNASMDEQAATLGVNCGISTGRNGVCYSLDRASFNQGINAQYKPQIEEELASALVARGPSAVCYPINTMVATRWNKDDNRTTFGIGEPGDPQFTLGAAHEHAVCYAVRTAQTNANGIGVAQDAHTLDGANAQAVCYRKTAHPRNADEAQGWEPTDKADTLNVFDNSESRTPTAVVESYQKVTGPLMANSHPGSYSGQDAYSDMLVTQKARPPRKYIIRRLTPLECCRLQGFPDWWEDGAQGSDSARYRMWGNGIALPNAEYVVGCAKRLMQGGNHED